MYPFICVLVHYSLQNAISSLPGKYIFYVPVFAYILSTGVACFAQAREKDKPDVYTIPAQNGLYVSAGSFNCGELSYRFASRQPGYRWKGLALEGSVTLITPDTSIQASEADFWGFRINQQDYRFYNQKTYQVIYHENIILYEKRFSGGDYRDIVVNYISLAADAPVYLLTRKNLLKVFSNNPKMIQALRAVKRPINWMKKMPPANRPLIIELYQLNR
jgi:hypothetical protein